MVENDSSLVDALLEGLLDQVKVWWGEGGEGGATDAPSAASCEALRFPGKELYFASWKQRACLPQDFESFKTELSNQRQDYPVSLCETERIRIRADA